MDLVEAEDNLVEEEEIKIPRLVNQAVVREEVKEKIGDKKI